MNKMDLFIIISSLALIFSVIGTIIGLVALIKTIAAEKSTHTMVQQMVPVDDVIDKENENYLQNRPWATEESAFAKEQDKFHNDLEVDMPDFAPDDDDQKLRSF